jgi:polyferredoxin
MQDFLLKTRDPEIMFRVKSARSSKGLRYAGFAAIPLLISSVVFYSFSFAGYNSNGQPTANRSMQGAAAGFLAGAVAVFGASIYFNINQKTQNRKAIKLYNEKYAGK